MVFCRGDRVKKRRLALGLSQDELAKQLGYTDRSTIAKIEAGKNDIPDNKVPAFAKALGTTPEYIKYKLIESLLAFSFDVEEMTGVGATITDELTGIKWRYDDPQWLRLQEADDFRSVWADYEAAKGQKEAPAPAIEDKRSQIQLIFDQLSPDNQTKLLELADLYLTGQRKTEET